MCGTRQDKKSTVPFGGHQSSQAALSHVGNRREQRRQNRELRTRLRNKVTADLNLHSHPRSTNLIHNDSSLDHLRPSLCSPTRLGGVMSSASLCFNCSNPITHSLLPKPSDMKKPPSPNIVDATSPVQSLRQRRKGISNKTASKVRTKQSYLSVMLPRNSRQSFGETDEPVPAFQAANSLHLSMKLVQKVPEHPASDKNVFSECHLLRANRKRSSSEAFGGKRISVLKFKRQRINEDDVGPDGSGTDPSSWDGHKNLSPVACSLAHVVPVRDDQRQTEMERQEIFGCPSASENASEPGHNLSISSLSPHAPLISNRSPKDRQVSDFTNPLQFHKHSRGATLPPYPDIPLNGGAIRRTKVAVEDFHKNVGSHPYFDNRSRDAEVTGKFTDQLLEKGMQHFLGSEVEASKDLSHPWHDLMSSKALAIQQDARMIGSETLTSSLTLPLVKTNGAHLDHFLLSSDDPSPNSICNMQSWGRGDFPPGESSPDSSSSDSQYHSGHFHDGHTASPSSPTSTLTRSTSGAGSTISHRTSLSSSSSSSAASVTSESSLSLDPLPEEGKMMLDAVNGFLLVLDSDANVLFVSENVTEHLGFQQVDMLGSDLRGYIHRQDIKELEDQFSDTQFPAGSARNLPTWMTRRMFYLGMKFSFFRPGNRAKESGYTLVQCNAKLRLGRKKCAPGQVNTATTRGRRKGPAPQSKGGGARRHKGRAIAAKEASPPAESAAQQGLVVKTMILLCRPVRTESVLEIRPDGNMFISRHDLGFHFIFCDPRVATLIGYEPSDMLGRTAYQFHSPWDAIICKHCAKQLILSGTAVSGYYRFLSRTGAWVWMVTSATIIYDTRRHPQYIVCKNYIVSATVAERDLSRQRKDFDMMKYSGYTLETKPALPLASSNKGNAGNLGSGSREYTYGESRSLVTLRPKLGDVNPSAMLERLFASEQIDVSNSPFHLARARKRAASGGQFRPSDARNDERHQSNGRHDEKNHSNGLHDERNRSDVLRDEKTRSDERHNEINHSNGRHGERNHSEARLDAASAFNFMDFEEEQLAQSEEVQSDADKGLGDESYGANLCEKNSSETGNFLSQSGYTHGLSDRAASPILTSLWRRDEQDSELLTSDFPDAEPVKMDISSEYDFFIPSSMANSIENGVNACDGGSSNGVDDSDGLSLRYASSTMSTNVEDNILQRDPFPILTTTNMYSLDFASMFSDTLSSDLSSFQPLLDPPQSIPLTNATSFSDGQDFMFPNATLSGVKFPQEPFLEFGSMNESERYERMDTPICFDTQVLDEGYETFSSNLQDSQSSGSRLISSDDAHFKNEGFGDSVSTMCTPSQDSTTSESDKTSSESESAMSQGIPTDTDMPEDHSTFKQVTHPNNVTILNDTVFRGDKLFKVVSQADTRLNGISSASTGRSSKQSISSSNASNMQSNVTTNSNFKTNGSFHGVGRLKQALTDPNPTSAAHKNHNHLLRDHVEAKSSSPTVQDKLSLLGNSGSKGFNSAKKVDDALLPKSNLSQVLQRPDDVSSHSVWKNGSTNPSPEPVENKESFFNVSCAPLNPADHDLVGSLASPQTETASGATSPSSSHLSTPLTQILSDSSSSSSDGENSGRPSLLRTLLDKEGAAIQGPVTYAEWVLQKTLKNKSSTEASDVFSKSISGKRAVNRKSRVRRGNIKRSTELPLPKYSHGSVVRYGKDALQHRKPTTELPLPSVSLSQSNSSTLRQSRCFGERPPGAQNNTSSSNISAEDFLLPDDLLDLAVEYCGSMGPEQTDALLSDFTEMSSLEENLFSLVGLNQTKADQVKSLSVKRLLYSPPPKTANNSFESDKQSSSTVSETHDTNSPRTVSPHDHYKPYLRQENSETENQRRQCSINNDNSKISTTTAKSLNTNAHMSLLRAAVTTPDVDKLIEQIPFGNRSPYDLGSSNRLSNGNIHESDSLDPDIVITKVSGLNNTSVKTANSFFTKGKSTKVSGKLEIKSHSPQTSSSKGRLDAIFFDHVYTTSPQVNKPINTPAASSNLVCETTPNGTTRRQSTSSKIIVSPSVSTKTAYSSHASVNGTTNGPTVGKQRQMPNSRIRSNGSTASSYPTRSPSFEGSGSGANSTKSDLSSTEPVSVMIMRKEAHRSRRSKSIAVQTDNVPGEVYPEFERSSTDVILYPRSCSVMTSQDSPHASAGCRDQQTTSLLSSSTASSLSSSPSPSTPTPSPASSMSQLERFLRGYSSSGENMDTAASHDEMELSPLSSSPRSDSTTPFLQRLLTGELSKDNYRRLDEQMREDERRQSGSSASDLELS
ncbi:hypothetical protein EGW08_005662 [Elysia chlorotica]|uniref:PAS domain-containing protein n=1 Tax=Elysia chlorotica TaxID=188477 RepID=A0A3S1AA67_ELYCH|nr:hypothetical protein EGW08_005662 [Elysia chlorotica]